MRSFQLPKKRMFPVQDPRTPTIAGRCPGMMKIFCSRTRIFTLIISQKRKKNSDFCRNWKMPFGGQKTFHLLKTTRNQFFLPYYYNSNLLQRKLKLLLAIFLFLDICNNPYVGFFMLLWNFKWQSNGKCLQINIFIPRV